MSGTLWREDHSLDAQLDAFTVGEDRAWDRRLITWDILGSLGHIESLHSSGLLTDREHARLRAALRRALRDAARGLLTVSDEDEDVHSAIEKRLIGELGDLGEKLHTGRSRNDQVLCDLRLWLKDRLLDLGLATLELASELLRFARRHRLVVLPGFTHQRRAMPSTIGLWSAGHAEALVDDLTTLRAAFDLLDRSPLGSAAGYGVPLDLDRTAAARALGFQGIQRGVTAVQASRAKIDVLVLTSLWAIAHDLGKFASDVIVFSADEHGYLALPAHLATGSSIMPHKRNPDVFELMRARASLVSGFVMQSMSIGGSLTSGYHRDLQLLKGPLFRGVDTVDEMIAMTRRALEGLEVDRDRCEQAIGGDLLATDEVFRRVRNGAPFRSAYRDVAEEVRSGHLPDAIPVSEIVRSRAHEGGAGRLDLSGTRREIEAHRRELRRRRNHFDRALARLAARRSWRG